MIEFIKFLLSLFKPKQGPKVEPQTEGSVDAQEVKPPDAIKPSVTTPSVVTPTDAFPALKDKIFKILNIFETGSVKTDYTSVFTYNDGPEGMKQITLGRGFTEFGNLVKIVDAYSQAGGAYSKDFQKYVGRVGKKPSLHSDNNFINLLKKSGSDPVMKEVQNKVFEDKYWIPSLKFFNDNKFSLPLSLLVIADSTLHSGSVLAFLRARFKELPPAKGGDEKKWISEYVKVRRSWLANHERKILQNTTYRCDTFLDAIKNDNWYLTKPVNAHGTTVA